MLDRFERSAKIVCLALGALLVWQLASLVLSVNPLSNLKIPALPVLPAETNEPVQHEQNGTNAAVAPKETNAVKGTNSDIGNHVVAAGATGTTNTISTNKPGAVPKPGPAGATPGLPPGMTPEMLASLPPEVKAQLMAGGMPGGNKGGGGQKIELPPEAQARVDKIIDSELFGPVIHPMPLRLIGIADQEAYIQATNGQTGPVKIGGELGGVKLLRIGVNRVLVEQDGEKKELTLFGGIGGESLMPQPTNMPSTNMASTNAPAKKSSNSKASTNDVSTNQTLSSKQKEIP